MMDEVWQMMRDILAIETRSWEKAQLEGAWQRALAGISPELPLNLTGHLESVQRVAEYNAEMARDLVVLRESNPSLYDRARLRIEVLRSVAALTRP